MEGCSVKHWACKNDGEVLEGLGCWGMHFTGRIGSDEGMRKGGGEGRLSKKCVDSYNIQPFPFLCSFHLNSQHRIKNSNQKSQVFSFLVQSLLERQISSVILLSFVCFVTFIFVAERCSTFVFSISFHFLVIV